MENNSQIIGVYCIKNKINNKVYIGESINIPNRWEKHLNKLNNKTHGNYALQSDYLKYSYENFEFTVLEYIDVPDNFDPDMFIDHYIKLNLVLLMREYYYQKQYNPFDTYNIRFSLNDVYNENKLYRNRKPYHDYLKAYDYSSEIKNKFQIFKYKNATTLIKEYLNSNDKIPVKLGYTRPYRLESTYVADDKQLLEDINKEKDLLILYPYYIDYVRPHNDNALSYHAFIGNEIKRINELDSYEYSPTLINYYLISQGYLELTNKTPKYMPTEKSFKDNLFFLSVDLNFKNPNFKVYVTDKGAKLIKEIISDIRNWINTIPHIYDFTKVYINQNDFYFTPIKIYNYYELIKNPLLNKYITTSLQAN